MFEINKFYKDLHGDCIKILAKVDSFCYGSCFVAESFKHDLIPLRYDSGYEWIEISKDQFMAIIAGENDAS